MPGSSTSNPHQEPETWHSGDIRLRRLLSAKGLGSVRDISGMENRVLSVVGAKGSLGKGECGRDMQGVETR